MDIIFPYAEAYARLMKPSQDVQERTEGYQAHFHWSERHLQCLWFDARYRPSFFCLANNETVTVLDPGEWNLEAGPDFLNVTVLVQPGGRRIRGDVEVHVHPSDWDSHGHCKDKGYDSVIAHVTWFSGPVAKTLPQSVLSLSLAEPITARLDLSLDDIDLKAYPHSVLPETPRPCEAYLKNNPSHARDMLQAAGQYRLQSKASRIRARLAQSGDRHQVFYEEFMAALGYKNNQQAFRGLARLVPVTQLKGLSRDAACAKLLAVARLLPSPDVARDEESRQFIRSLWDIAWKQGDELLPGDLEWHLHNSRPQNSPVRRIAAASTLFSGLRDLLCDIEHLASIPGHAWFAQVTQRIESHCAWPLWNQRLSMGSPSDEEHPVALLGEARIAAIITNVIFPFVAVEEVLPQEAILYLPPEEVSAPMRLTALHLFGRDHNPAVFYADNGLLQQGLLQIYLDFCLNAGPDCEGCSLCQTLQT
ncbi:MAG: DUF2851 family protein [bacterium]